MYNEYFGFKEAPFSIAPDPRYLYMTTQHRDALAHLIYGLNSDGGCILLTGEVGTGKTTICRCLLEQIPEQANVALVLNPKVNEIELLETICDELKISYPELDQKNTVKTYTDRIYEFLIKSNRDNEKTVLIIDEAQNLDSKVLEQLRLLTNLETNQRKLLQIIILGQPELLDILAKTEMRQLAQRITARFHLQPLTKEEVKAYVSHRLAVAGQNIQLFPENSIKLLYKLSNGVPRLINILCDRALLGAYVEAQHSVHPSILKKAATEVFGELKNVERQQKNKQILYPVAAVASVAIIAIALFLFFTFSPAPETLNLSEKDNEAGSTTSIDTTADIATIETTPALIEGDVSKSPLPASIASDETIQSSDISINESVDLAEEASDTPADTSVDTPADTPVNPPLLAKQKFDEIGVILSAKRNGHISAYQELFKAWNQTYNKKSLVTACKQAKTFALSCLHKQGNLNSLKAHNRPAVLKLVNNNGKTQYVTITSIQDKLATVYSNNKEYTIQLSDLDQYWFGQFIILWQRPEHYSSVITPGDNGSIVNWLNAHFTENKPSLDNTANTYDDELIKKVKQFQADHGLSADGIVGPVTIIHLNTESDLNVPTLARQS